MKLDLLFQHAADLGCEVVWERMGDRGDYAHGIRVIRLNPDLITSQLVAVMSHEVAHAEFGDDCTSPAVERRADEYGASLIIEAEEYAEAEALVGPHPGALAVELGVTRRVIEAWRRWYRRRWAA